MRADIGLLSAFGDSPRLRADQQGSVAMNSLKTDSLKTGSFTTRHLSVRLRKIRSLKPRALQSKPPKIVMAAARTPSTKPFVKSLLPYGLVIASLALSGGAMATEAHAKTAQPVH